jgi:arginase
VQRALHNADTWTGARRAQAACLSSSGASSPLGGFTSPNDLWASKSKAAYLPPVPKPFSMWLSEPKTAVIVGAPIMDGQTLTGVEQGPDWIRSAGLAARLEADEWKVVDEGNLNFKAVSASFAHIPFGTARSAAAASVCSAVPSRAHVCCCVRCVADANPRAKRSMVVGETNRVLYEMNVGHAQAGRMVLTLGGDHSMGIGSLASALKARPDSAFIWVDAHGDINTPSTTISGNMHGMVLALLMDLEQMRSSIQGFDWLARVPLLLPNKLVYIGLRDLDEGEKKIIRALGIQAFTMHEIDKYGIAKVMEMAIAHTQGRNQHPIHLSVDIDSVDPAYAPSTGTRVAGGLLYREAYYMCEALAATGMLTSMDLAEVNPTLSTNEVDQKATVSLAVGLIASALGNKIL